MVNPIDITKLMNRIKALQEFEITRTLPDGFRFQGNVPFDMTINGDKVKVKIIASTLDEAMQRWDSYFFK